MPLDIEALQAREIDREGAFTPIQFADIARGAIGVGQQFEDSQQAREDKQLQRTQAAQMQKILNGGDAAIMQIFNAMPEDQRSLVYQGNQDILKSVLAGKDGSENALRVMAEAQTGAALRAAPSRNEQATILLERGQLGEKSGGKSFLSSTKPTADKSGISDKAAALFDKGVNDDIKTFIEKNGRDPNKIEALRIVNQKGIDLNIRADDPIRKVIADKFVIASGISTPKIQLEKFEEEKRVRLNTAIRKMGTKFTSKKREVVIAANEVNRAIDGGVFGDKFKNLISGTFLDGLKERLQLSEDSPTVIATIINAFTKGKLKDAEEAERVRRVKADDKFKELFNNPEFNNVMVSLSTLMTKVLRLESGAAITGTDIEDKKNNFGFDAIGTPESFLIGIGNFMEGLKADVTQIANEEPDEKARSFFKKSFESNPLASPFELPQRPEAETPKTIEVKRSRREELIRKRAE